MKIVLLMVTISMYTAHGSLIKKYDRIAYTYSVEEKAVCERTAEKYNKKYANKVITNRKTKEQVLITEQHFCIEKELRD